MNFKLRYTRNGVEYTQNSLRKTAGGGRTRYEADGIAVVHEARRYAQGMEEYRLLVKNTGNLPLDILQAFPFSMELDIAGGQMQHFTSAWCKESGLVTRAVEPFVLQNEKGRASHGFHPQMFFKTNNRYVAAVVVAWSGNWKIEIEQVSEAFIVTAGMSDVHFRKTIQPGEIFDSFRVLAVRPSDGTLDSIAHAFTAWHREYNSPKNQEALKIPVEWNHWWPYEDVEIDEKTFLACAGIARELGCEICMLDAGWFGSGSGWYEVRGDWDRINTERFPSGLRTLSDAVHTKGLKFGIWCEIEALGVKSELGQKHPNFAALRDGQHLGYVCLANPEAWNWALSVLEGLIADYNVDWIKVDFNLDPGYGCNRTDHGHGAGDGLYEHYRGLYRLIDTIRSKYPHVIIEACSSGGLRIDHELLHHFDFHHLSDTDETVHKLRFYHHNLTVLPPEACLHWAWSDARINENGDSAFPPFQPWDPKYAPYEVDTHIRIGMLGVFGLSHRLPLFSEELKTVFAGHIDFYKQTVREFIKRGFVAKLAPREFVPEMDLYAVQYTLESEGRALAFVFAKSEQPVMLRLQNLCPEKWYKVGVVDTGEQLRLTGKVLMESGLDLGILHAWESRILHVEAL